MRNVEKTSNCALNFIENQPDGWITQETNTKVNKYRIILNKQNVKSQINLPGAINEARLDVGREYTQGTIPGEGSYIGCD